MAEVQPGLEDLETKEGSAVVLGLCCGGGCVCGGATGGSLSPDWATRSTQGICLLSLPTKEFKIIDFPGSIPKDHASAEATCSGHWTRFKIFVTFGDCHLRDYHLGQGFHHPSYKVTDHCCPVLVPSEWVLL